jgi:hypothetical protein
VGGDRLDQQLGPVAEFLLIVIALLFVAAVTAYFLSKAVQRRKERAHGKLSGSRRTNHSKIDLLTRNGPGAEAPKKSSAKSRTRSSAPRIDILKRPDQ